MIENIIFIGYPVAGIDVQAFGKIVYGIRHRPIAAS
jgi:hypothetical protein